MKKLLILFAAGALSVCVNAATVTWGSSVMKLPSGNNAGTSVNASLFIVTEDIYNSFAAYTDATKLSDAVYAAYGSETAAAMGTTKKNYISLSDGAEYSSGSTIYAVLIYKTTENGIDYWMGNYGKASIESSQNVTVAGFGSFVGGGSSGTATSWSTAAVPEPTSGLLLLLGMAGLALKRKRA